jgi:hypothetical protein
MPVTAAQSAYRLIDVVVIAAGLVGELRIDQLIYFRQYSVDRIGGHARLVGLPFATGIHLVSLDRTNTGLSGVGRVAELPVPVAVISELIPIFREGVIFDCLTYISRLIHSFYSPWQV